MVEIDDNVSVYDKDDADGDADNDADDDDENVNELLQVLQWIGIPSIADCQKIQNKIAEDLSDFKLSSKDDIDSAINNLVKAKTAANRVSIPQRARNSILALMHWVQDFYPCGQEPTIAHLDTETAFRRELNVAAQREK
jgi:hypothetical protein